METTRENLSSLWTFFYKFCFPTIWIGGFGAGTIGMWVSTFNGNAGPPLQIRLVFLLMLIAVSAYLYWSCVRLKKVQMDSHYLYISNYSNEIQVPLAQIESVTEFRWDNTHPVTIHFSLPTKFGPSVTFMPKIRLFGLWSDHPVVSQILNATGQRNIRPT